MARLVLSDASPLIGLSRVDGVPWLEALFGRVEVTAQVLAELEAGRELEAGIGKALEDGRLLPRPGGAPTAKPPPHLGPGEWSTLEAAKVHPGPSLVLMDDRLARREARSLGIPVVGTAALVGRAQTRGIIDSAREVFARLLQSDFRLSPAVLRAVLDRVESD